MDTDWFIERMRLLGIDQQDLGHAIGRHYSSVSRFLSEQRRLTLAEVEPLAALLQVPPLELIERAHTWSTPIRIQSQLRVDLLRIAVSCATDALSVDAALIDEIARDVAGIYKLLVDSEARGSPIDGDVASLRLITDLLRITRASKP